MSSGGRGGRVPHEPTPNLFVAGFPTTVSDDDLKALFAPYGEIESAKVMLDIHTGASRGFGFVLFTTVASAVAAKDALQESLHPVQLQEPAPPVPEGAPPRRLNHYRLAVDFAKHDAFNVVRRSTKVYCRNIPTTMTDEEVRDKIEEVVGLNTIVSISVLPDSSRSPALFDKDNKGRVETAVGAATLPLRANANVAFVEFTTVDEAQIAVDKTYKMRLEGPGSEGPLLTKFAETAQVRSERMKRVQRTEPVLAGGPPSYGQQPPHMQHGQQWSSGYPGHGQHHHHHHHHVTGGPPGYHQHYAPAPQHHHHHQQHHHQYQSGGAPATVYVQHHHQHQHHHHQHQHQPHHQHHQHQQHQYHQQQYMQQVPMQMVYAQSPGQGPPPEGYTQATVLVPVGHHHHHGAMQLQQGPPPSASPAPGASGQAPPPPPHQQLPPPPPAAGTEGSQGPFAPLAS